MVASRMWTFHNARNCGTLLMNAINYTVFACLLNESERALDLTKDKCKAETMVEDWLIVRLAGSILIVLPLF